MTSINSHFLISDDDRRQDPAQSDSAYLPYYPDPIQHYENTTITPLIDGVTYFEDLYAELEKLRQNRQSGVSSGSDQRIYIAGWGFNKDFVFRVGEEEYKFTELLKEAADDGVDVRLLLWMNVGLVSLDNIIPRSLSSFTTTCENNAATAEDLRMNANLENKVILNVLNHFYGSSHMKMVLLVDSHPGGDDQVVAYSGGIDFDVFKDSYPRHEYDVLKRFGIVRQYNFWHDVQTRIDGDATVAVFDYYKALWNELVARRDKEGTGTYEVGTWPHAYFKKPLTYSDTTYVRVQGVQLYAVPEFAERIDTNDSIRPTAPASPQNIVQSLRTIPDVTRRMWPAPHDFYTVQPGAELSFAPDGSYEVYLGMKKAIEKATDYLYFENQVTHSRDLLQLIKVRMEQCSTLKVIFVTATDPNPERFTDFLSDHNYYLYEYLYQDLDEDQQKRVVLYQAQENYIHSKVMIADDKFAIIGSANFANRSMFADFEHVVSFVDHDGYNSVQQFRQKLWAEHFRSAEDDADLIAEIDNALHVWNPEWGTANAAFKLPDWAGSEWWDLTVENRSYQDGNFPEGIDFPASLFPLRVFDHDLDGNQLDFKGPVSRATSGTEISFVDDDLPDPATVDLDGGWVYIMSGPNQDTYIYISSHDGQQLTFSYANLDEPFDGSTEYLLLYPSIRLKSIAWWPYFTIFSTPNKEIEEIGALP